MAKLVKAENRKEAEAAVRSIMDDMKQTHYARIKEQVKTIFLSLDKTWTKDLHKYCPANPLRKGPGASGLYAARRVLNEVVEEVCDDLMTSVFIKVKGYEQQKQKRTKTS